ncbi:MAG: hypothetical protein UV73_C0003G0193 [Candidatus Gottesmanbacteria bacterium GW2011_GWA2_43_14]|uniref:Baseplate protein J-like domain-containing protein n=1 Tax=Candidatus Gottesmanbacteria bacterium GW2011_GWA2_43_14 TaxID=1618443 RepID=A0A0G1FT99_9BACT|nr:MAG: hypothetical protein UV73_C0003G0193 [Candidatus Gottesmanbacteria bacterium GW2011_GWA2_43_14]
MSLLSQILPKKESIDYFLTLGIEENLIRAAVTELSGDKAKILGIGKSEFSDENHETEACDIAITMAEKEAGSELLVEKVIFALPQIYLEGENVKPEYLKKLKKVTKELNLKAGGFIDYSSAVAFFLEQEEGAPPTVILMDISRSHLTISMVRIGKVQQNIIVPRTESLIEDFTAALPKLKAEILPSRIILYDNSEKTDGFREELLKFPWHKHSIFLHTPKIEILSNEKILSAIVKASSTSFLQPDTSMEEKAEPAGEKSGEDEPKLPGEKPADNDEIKELQAENFGFVEETGVIPPPVETKQVKPAAGKFPLPEVKLPEINLPQFKLPSLPSVNFRGKTPFVLSAVLVTTLLGILGFMVLKYPKSSVALIVYPLPREQNLKAVFSSDVKDGSNAIPVRTVESEVAGSKNATTTGKAQIGDKSRGEVTIYNRTAASKTFDKGVVLTSGPLKFTLDEDVKVASSSETNEGITFGKTGAKITASAIGPESNLPAQAEFTFSDLSSNSFTAKNTQALSGGTSREIPSVSREDRLKLEENLMSELASQAKQKLSGQQAAGERLLEEPVETTVSSKKFSAGEGEEAKELELAMSVKVAVYVYRQSDLEALAKNTEAPALPGYRLDPDKLSIKVIEAEKDESGEISTSLKLTSYYLPEFDMDKISGELAGKSYDEAQNYLEKVENVGGIQIVADKSLPFMVKKLPLSKDGITLRVISK